MSGRVNTERPNTGRPPGAPALPKLMGIINATPDSFSDGGLHLDPRDAVVHARKMVESGADVIDVGGESTRPGAEPVAAEVELGRVIPVIEAVVAEGLAGPDLPAGISIDTSKAVVAEAAIDAGARTVNDVTALRADPEIADLCAGRGARLILMHMLGRPRSMQVDPRYNDLLGEVREFLGERVELARAAGIDDEKVSIDPGIGFGKTRAHNFELLARLDELTELGCEIVVGTSRKTFIGGTDAPAVGRLGGTIASGIEAWSRGAATLRVHDVAPMRQALEIAAAIRSA